MDLARKVELLNELTRRRLELEAQLRMVDNATPVVNVRVMKRQLIQVNNRIARLEARLR